MASVYQILIGGGIAPSVFQSFSRLNTVLGGLATSLAGFSITRSLQEAIGRADEMGRLAQKTGIATEALSGISHAAKLADVEMSTLQTSLKSLSQYLTRTGQGGKPLDQALLEIADQFERMPDGAQKAAMAVERFGRSGLDMIPMLNGGRAEMAKMMRESDKFGTTISAEFAKNADTFGDNITRIKEAGRGLWNLVADRLLPDLIKLSEWFLDTIDTFNLHEIALAAITSGYRTLAEVMAGLSTVMKTIMVGVMFPVDVMRSGLSVAVENVKRTMDEIMDQHGERLRDLAEIGQPRSKQNGRGTGESMPAVDRLTYLQAIRNDDLAKLRAIDSLEYSRMQKDRDRLANLERQLSAVREMEQILKPTFARGDGSGTGVGSMTADEVAALERYNQVMRERVDLEKSIRDIRSEMSFENRFARGIQALSDEWENFGKNFADVATNGIKRSIDAVSESITNAIMGVQSWGQAFAQVGTAIIGDIIRITVQWIASQTILRALSAIFGSTTAASTAGQAAAMTAAWAPAATLASIATMGAAAGVGLATMTASLAAGIGIGTAASGLSGLAGASFAVGGYTGDGPRATAAGIVHGREFVIPAGPTADFGVPFFEAIRQGQLTPEMLAGGSKQPVNVKVGVLRTRQDIREYMAEEGFAYIINELGNRSNRFNA